MRMDEGWAKKSGPGQPQDRDFSFWRNSQFRKKFSPPDGPAWDHLRCEKRGKVNTMEAVRRSVWVISISYLHSILMNDTISLFRWLAAWWSEEWHCVQFDTLTTQLRFERHLSAHKLFRKIRGKWNIYRLILLEPNLIQPCPCLVHIFSSQSCFCFCCMVCTHGSLSNPSCALYAPVSLSGLICHLSATQPSHSE